MSDRRDEEMTGELREAIELLREPPRSSELWRQKLLNSVAAAPRPDANDRAEPRRLSIRVSTAVAAGLLCALTGAVGTVALMSRAAARQPVQQLAGQEPLASASRVRFSLVAPSATSVFVVGDFNHWNAAALPMQRSPDGRTWEIEVPLSAGRYAYAFVVDGRLARDPTAPQAGDDGFGSPNSVIMVSGS